MFRILIFGASFTFTQRCSKTDAKHLKKKMMVFFRSRVFCFGPLGSKEKLYPKVTGLVAHRITPGGRFESTGAPLIFHNAYRWVKMGFLGRSWIVRSHRGLMNSPWFSTNGGLIEMIDGISRLYMRKWDAVTPIVYPLTTCWFYVIFIDFPSISLTPYLLYPLFHLVSDFPVHWFFKSDRIGWLVGKVTGKQPMLG